MNSIQPTGYQNLVDNHTQLLSFWNKYEITLHFLQRLKVYQILLDRTRSLVYYKAYIRKLLAFRMRHQFSYDRKLSLNIESDYEY